MKRAKISELKNRLSHYLDFVRRGEAVLVYDRDRVIARLEPVRQAALQAGVDASAELERAGLIRAPATALPRDWLDQRPSFDADIIGTLLEEREGDR